MKRGIKLFVAISLLTILPYLTNAQTESPGAKDNVAAENQSPNRGDGGNPPPPGGGAPIGGGLFILLGLGAAYGGKKLYHLNK